MSKATEDQLSRLHGKVAESMAAALDQSDRAERLLKKYEVDDEVVLPKDIKRFLEDAKEVNPSLLTVATKFLKDNSISCDPAEDSALAELQESLKKKRKRGNVTQISFED